VRARVALRDAPAQAAAAVAPTRVLAAPGGSQAVRTSPQGISAAERDRLAAQWRDAQPMTAACLFCDWTLDATVGECRDAVRAHRELEHPGAIGRTRRARTSLTRPDQRLSEQEYEEAKRARQLKDDASRLAGVARRAAEIDGEAA
jgi:hypothetical protein